ncbi:MAG TPA: hypothetical protein PK509_00525 [Catalimonadaceae bacterium]|nr:hypothetical protein [Catalimonadaceae bacterium]HPI09752.1 hypothetical protein [Catalimonadaceae bacterium]
MKNIRKPGCFETNPAAITLKSWDRVRKKTMAEFGNILSVFGSPDGATMAKVINAVTSKSLKFIQIEQTFYLQTDSPGNARLLADAIRAMGVKFTLYYNFIPDSSFVKRGQIEDAVFSEIEHILLD